MEPQEKHFNKNVWGKGGSREGQYHRHSVDRDVQFFVGWQKLEELFATIKNLVYQNVGIVAFLLAARISEVLQSHRNMFAIDYEAECLIVSNFPILKRWKAIDMKIICGRCGAENDKFEQICTKCRANLVFAGKRKYITEKVPTVRQDFYIPLKERFVDRLVQLLENSSEYLFISPYTAKPYTRQWAHIMVKEYGPLVGLDTLYNHWFRSQRLTQLKNELHFSRDDLKAFSGIRSDEVLDIYAKSIQGYTEKMGLKVVKIRQESSEN